MAEKPKQYASNTPGSFWAWAYWWSFLVVAVLAVPSVGFLIAMVVPEKEIGQLVVFVLTCWTCTYLGMRLMKK